MMKYLNSILFSLVLLGLIMLSSCTHYYYAPNEGVILGLSEKNDVKFSGSFGSSNNDGGGSNRAIQLGYSPLKHVGLQGSYFRNRAERTINDDMKLDQISILNGAIGGYYFFDLSDDKEEESNRNSSFKKPGILVDLYLGYSSGTVDNQYTNTSFSHFDFNKTFGQIGIHWPMKLFEIDYVVKFGNLDFKNGTVTRVTDFEHLDNINSVVEYDSYSFTESTLRVQFGVKESRFFLSRTWFTTPNLDEVPFLNVSYHFGIVLELDEIYRQVKRNNY